MKFTIQRRLILWLIVVALPISAACIITVSLVRSSLTERVIASLENDHRLETARIESALRQYKRIANGLANNRSIRTALSIYSSGSSYNTSYQKTALFTAVEQQSEHNYQTDPILNALIKEISSLAQTMDAGVAQFRISTFDGKISDQTDGYSWIPADKNILARAAELRQPVFGEAFLNPDEEAMLGIVVPIFASSVVRNSDNRQSDNRKSDNNGVPEILGSMAIEMRLGPIVDLVEAHEGMGATSESHIAQPTPEGDAQFITLLRFKRDAAFNAVVPKSADKPINWSLESPQVRVVRSPDYRHIQSFLAIGTIADTGWGLVVKIDEDEAFIPLYEITSLIWKAGIVSLLLLIISWFTLIRPLALRLQSTAVAADRLATGNYDQLIKDAAPDEIGTVSNSIDRLATDLKADKLLRERAERSLKYQADHDALTGLYNRKYLQDVTETLVPGESGTIFSVLFMDLDGFKAINDQHGHHIGDEILVTFAAELKLVMPEDSIASRWGGDEFVVILPSSESDCAADLAHLISRRFEKPFATSNGLMSLGCSIGTSTSATCMSVADCVKHADAKMYEAKQARKAA